MEEKERKQLKKRLLGLVINEPPYPYPITMAEVMVNDMSKPNLKPLLNFIEKELDRAREEGYADGVEHRKRRAKKYFMDGKVGDDLDLLDHADSTYKLTTR